MLAHQLSVGLCATEGKGWVVFMHPAGSEPAKVSREVKVHSSRHGHQEEENINPHCSVSLESRGKLNRFSELYAHYVSVSPGL